MKKLLIVAALLVLLFPANNVLAQSQSEVIKREIKIDINFDYTGNVEYTINFKNNSAENIITQYSLDLPITDVISLQGFLNGVETRTTLSQGDNGTNIQLFFDARGIYPGVMAEVRIKFKLNNLVTEERGIKKMHYPQHGDGTTSLYSIKYPKIFGKHGFITARNVIATENTDSYTLNFSSTKGIFTFWGMAQTIDVNGEYIFNNPDINSQHYLFTLPSSINSQEVKYKVLKGFDYGMQDANGNIFGVVSLQGNESKQINFALRLKNINLAENNSAYPTYDFNLGESSLDQELKSIASDLSLATIEKVKKISDLLASSTKAVTTAENDFESGFSHCAKIAAVANTLNIKSRIYYGYLLFTEVSSLTAGYPHVWCEVSIENQNYVIDSYLEKITGFDFFGISPSDRFIMGIWDQKNYFDEALGVINDTNPIRVTFEKNDFAEITNPSIDFTFVTKSNEISARKIQGYMQYTSRYNDFVKISSISVNNLILNSFVPLSGKSLVILPNTDSRVPLSFNSQTDLFFQGSKNFKLEVNNTSGNPLRSEITIEFTPNWILIYLGISTIVITIMLLIFLILRDFKKGFFYARKSLKI